MKNEGYSRSKHRHEIYRNNEERISELYNKVYVNQEQEVNDMNI